MRGTRRPVMRIQQWCSHFHDPRPTAQNTLAEGQPQPMGSQPTKIWWNLTLSTENVQSYTNGFVRRSWLASKSQTILLQAWKTTLALKLLKPSLRPENNKQPCRWTPVFLQWKCTEFSVGQPLTHQNKQPSLCHSNDVNIGWPADFNLSKTKIFWSYL